MPPKLICLVGFCLAWSGAWSQSVTVTEPLMRYGLGTLQDVAYSPDGRVIATAGGLGVVLWDVRTIGEFEGMTAGWNPPPRLGHLPGAIHLEYIELFDADSGTLKPAAELTALLEAKGITPEASVTTY